MESVLAALPKNTVSHWSVASWLVSPEPELDDDRPIDVLRQGAATRVVEVALRWAGSLAA
jgi:uncharacterized protein (DUF2384 family)